MTRKLPDGFNKQKDEFIHFIGEIRKEKVTNILTELVNFDQTSVNLVDLHRPY